MKKNWYVIYTKPKCERKVAATFTKRKIENFFPVNCKHLNSLRRSKLIYEPLFDSYLFVNVTETDIAKIRLVDGVVSLVYWKGKPAIMNDDEIEAIKEFISYHQDIKLEKTQVKVNGTARIIDGPRYSMEGNVLSVKNKMVKVNLPSIGFSMIAEMENESIMGREVSFGNRDLLFQS